MLVNLLPAAIADWLLMMANCLDSSKPVMIVLAKPPGEYSTCARQLVNYWGTGFGKLFLDIRQRCILSNLCSGACNNLPISERTAAITQHGGGIAIDLLYRHGNTFPRAWHTRQGTCQKYRTDFSPCNRQRTPGQPASMQTVYISLHACYLKVIRDGLENLSEPYSAK